MDSEQFERIREAVVRALEVNSGEPRVPKPRTVKLSAVEGRGSGVHMAVVPPENEAPYSSVHESLCGIGNNYFFDMYWRKTIGTADCAECVGKADELYAEGAELFDPASYQPRGWYMGPPTPVYDFCPIGTLDGMLDLPTISTREGTDSEA